MLWFQNFSQTLYLQLQKLISQSKPTWKNSTPKSNTQRPCPWWIIEFCDQQQPKNGRKKTAAKNPPLTKIWLFEEAKTLDKILKLFWKTAKISCMYRVLFLGFCKKKINFFLVKINRKKSLPTQILQPKKKKIRST